MTPNRSVTTTTDGKQNKYLFRISVVEGKREKITVHEYFATTPKQAEKFLRERFGPDADITYVEQTG